MPHKMCVCVCVCVPCARVCVELPALAVFISEYQPKDRECPGGGCSSELCALVGYDADGDWEPGKDAAQATRTKAGGGGGSSRGEAKR
eukprot:1157454-Pelagomonas_calceolata.AAC.9